jgi:hypothetical protein
MLGLQLLWYEQQLYIHAGFNVTSTGKSAYCSAVTSKIDARLGALSAAQRIWQQLLRNGS